MRGPARSGTRTDGSRSLRRASACRHPGSRARCSAARPGSSRRFCFCRRSRPSFRRRSCRWRTRARSPRCSVRRCSSAPCASRSCGRSRGSCCRSLASIAPAVLALRSGELAAYHGAEHISIGSYEHGKRATKEHERCGGHLVGPLLVTSAIGNVLAGLAPERHRSTRRQLRRSVRSGRQPSSSAGCRGTLSIRSREHCRSRDTSSSTASRRRSRAPSSSRWPRPRSRRAWSSSMPTAAGRPRPRGLRPPRREDARGLVHRRVLQPRPGGASRRRPPSAGRRPGLPEAPRLARRGGRGDRHPPALLARAERADDPRPPRRRSDRAVGDGADDRGRLHDVCAPRDAVPRHARAADADHDERRARARGGERQAAHLHAGALRPSPRAGGRRLCGLRGGTGHRLRDRGHERRAGFLVGRARDRHRAALPDRGLRWGHRRSRRASSPSGLRRTCP